MMILSTTRRGLERVLRGTSQSAICTSRWFADIAEPFHAAPGDSKFERQVYQYDAALPLQKASTPPSGWYKDEAFFKKEQEAVFFRNWVAVDVFDNPEPGAFKSGTFLGEPYLLTRSPSGALKAFSNVCTHAGSCLVGPWTTSKGQELDPSLVGQSTHGCLSKGQNFQCPYHGWEFNSDGRLAKATHLAGIQNFRAKDFSLKPIPLQQMGPLVFLNFGEDPPSSAAFQHSRDRLFGRLERNGFVPDLSDVELVETREYRVEVRQIEALVEPSPHFISHPLVFLLHYKVQLESIL